MIRGANGFAWCGNARTTQRTGVEQSQGSAPAGRRGWRTTNPAAGERGAEVRDRRGGTLPTLGSARRPAAPLQSQPFQLPPPLALGPTATQRPHRPRHTRSSSSSPLPDTAAMGIGGSPPEHPSPSLLPLPAPAPRGLPGLALASPAQGDGRGLTCIHPLAPPVQPMGPQRPALPT